MGACGGRGRFRGGYALLLPRSEGIERSTAPAITAQPASSWSGGTSPMMSGVSAAAKTISIVHIMLASEAEMRRSAEKSSEE